MYWFVLFSIYSVFCLDSDLHSVYFSLRENIANPLEQLACIMRTRLSLILDECQVQCA
jgi:hypothetical protein